jgi:hypothetical protein
MIFDGVLVIGRFLRFQDARIHGYPSHARCSLDWRAWTLPKQHLLLYYGQSTEMRERERERERRERARERERVWGLRQWEWKVGVKINGMRGGWERIWTVACRHQVQEVHITLLLLF